MMEPSSYVLLVAGLALIAYWWVIKGDDE